MIAVIETGGKQYIVRKGDEILVDALNTDKKTISFDPLLVSDEEGTNTQVGTPTLSGAKVTCKVLGEEKGDKVRVFKMKAKKRYARTRGFRASLTRVEVTTISTGDDTSSAPAKKTTTKSTTSAKSTTKKTTAKKAAPKKASTAKKAS